MLLRDIGFFLTEAFISIRRSGLMAAISTATIGVSLIVFGIFLLISANISNISDFFSDKLEIRIFLKESISAGQISSMKHRLEAMPEFKSVTFVSKDKAWRDFRKGFQSLDLTDLVENPLPHSFKLTLKDNEQIVKTAKYVRGFENVEDVGYMGTIAERITKFAAYTRLAGFILVSLLTLATLLIVVNTIRLTVIARQDEITIMHLVGATVPFIRWPFIIEGALMGLAGSCASVAILSPLYGMFVVRIQEKMPYIPILQEDFRLTLIYLTLIIVGTSLGIFGSYISVSRTIKNPS
jgi:cell division transport system permease protein